MIRAAFYHVSFASRRFARVTYLSDISRVRDQREILQKDLRNVCLQPRLISCAPMRGEQDVQDVDLALLGADAALDLERTVLFRLHDRRQFRHLGLSQLNLLELQVSLSQYHQLTSVARDSISNKSALRIFAWNSSSAHQHRSKSAWERHTEDIDGLMFEVVFRCYPTQVGDDE
jgi:hypothetical protein